MLEIFAQQRYEKKWGKYVVETTHSPQTRNDVIRIFEENPVSIDFQNRTEHLWGNARALQEHGMLLPLWMNILHLL